MKSPYLVVIPAFNEEESIVKVVNSISALSIDADILVINDGSSDCTEIILKSRNLNVISLPFNLGYGAALQTGYKYATQRNYEYIIQFDGDGQHDANDIKTIIEILTTTDSDIVIGSRFLGKGNFKLGFMKKTAINIFRFLIRHLTRTKITDPTSGLQGLKRGAFEYFSKMGHYPSDFPDADILIFMLRSGYKITEFPTNIKVREAGKSMHSGLKPIIYFIKILLSIIIILLRSNAKKGA